MSRLRATTAGLAAGSVILGVQEKTGLQLMFMGLAIVAMVQEIRVMNRRGSPR